jgi:hypothetical protein
MDRETLARRVEAISDQSAAMIRDEQRTEVDQYPTPFFGSAVIYRIVHNAPRRPLWFPIGCAEPDFTTSLTMDPQAFFELARRGGLVLNTPALRINYLRTFFDTTRMTNERLEFLRSVDDIPLINMPTEEEKQRHQQIRDKFRPLVQAPSITESSPWQAKLYALKGQDLVVFDAVLNEDGRVQSQVTKLESNLPINTVK